MVTPQPKQYPSMRSTPPAPSQRRGAASSPTRLRTLLSILAICTAVLVGLQLRHFWGRRSSPESTPAGTGVAAPLMDSSVFSSMLGWTPKSKTTKQEQEWDPNDPYRPLSPDEIKSFSMDDIQSMFDFIQTQVDFDKVPSSSSSSQDGEDTTTDRASRFGRLRAAMGKPQTESRSDL